MSFPSHTMSRRRSNRSSKLEDEADVEYTIEMPFHNRDSKILLLDREDEGIEVIVGDIPTPKKHDLDRNYPDNLDDEETMYAHAAAKWIVTETTQMFDEFDWKTSSYKSNNPNYHLRDIYFTCDRTELDDAVMTAKKFLMILEEKSLRHAREYDLAVTEPAEKLESTGD